jgi:sensor histidine kinase YesM
MMGQIRLNMLLMLLIILISLAEAVWLIRYIRLEVILPMRDMKENMDRMQDGNYGLRITKEYHNSEFALLKGTFNQLMDEIVGLKIKSYEKKLELQEAELKSIRLQIRPHFFLNAMTTISSLSIQGKNGEIKRYIDALSKNIRYMFKSGLHTVPISEEIRHVENYFEMQELKYPGCVFYFIEMQPGVETWRIPQMLIHTIIENEYKYAVAWDGILTILIKAEKVILERKEFLSLEIEDDGRGYPQDVLEQFASEEIGPDEEGSRVGLWSVRRMIELMYEGEGSFQIENLVPKGAMNRFRIPSKAVQEFHHESHNKGEP